MAFGGSRALRSATEKRRAAWTLLIAARTTLWRRKRKPLPVAAFLESTHSTMKQSRAASLAKKFVPVDPVPLTCILEDGALSVRFQEGGRATLPGGRHRSSQSIFCLALWGSLHLDGRPVRCTGIVPGVSVRIEAGGMKLNDDEAVSLADDVWHAAYSRLGAWLAGGPRGPAKFGMSARDGLEIEFAWMGASTLRPSAMQIDVEYTKAFEQAYIASRAHRPLIELAPGQPEPPITVEQSPLAGLIRRAMEKTIQADSPLYKGLPIPVRYRISGAIEAWTQVREAAGRSGADFSQRLTSAPLGDLMHNFPQYLTAWTRGNSSCIGDEDDMGHAQRSVIMQAFSASQGALYEPTPALHRLLDDAYIADDVPLSMIRLPVDTLCIVPDPSWWGRRKGVEIILLFCRRREVDGKMADMLSCQTWGRRGSGDEQRIRLELIEFAISDTEQTVKRLFDNSPALLPEDAAEAPAPGARPYWKNVLDYAIKMLLYLTVRDAHVVHDRAYSGASRDVSGLGKRRRTERLAEIERLYDRYIVGPAVLDAEVARSASAGGDNGEVRGHWRRAHFRMQPHGPNSSLRKLVFIGPTIVRPDRLGL